MNEVVTKCQYCGGFLQYWKGGLYCRDCEQYQMVPNPMYKGKKNYAK